MTYPEATRLRDAAGRRQRAARMLKVLSVLGGVDLPRARLLDLGASHGLITLELAGACADTVGIDVDQQAIAAAGASTRGRSSPVFLVASGQALPFAAASFDVVVCNHVYEHVPDAGALMAEIHRVLVPGGTCYFAGGHLLQLVEPHYRLPLLSWLPRPLADAYLRLSGRGRRYEEKFVLPWRVHRLFKDFAAADLASARMLRDPAGFQLAPSWTGRVTRRLPGRLLRALALWLPTQVWLLRR